MSNRKGPLIGFCMTPSLTKFGEFIRTRRLELKLSQIQVAKSSGIRQTDYSHLEVGIAKYPTMEQLNKLAKVLQCSLSELKSLALSKEKNPQTELGKFIRERREELKLSLSDFAQRLKISEKKAMRMELGRKQALFYRALTPLARALKVENSVLMKFVKKKDGGVLGQLICNRRMELGMTTRELAERLGITHQAVNHIERGKTKLNMNNMRIARFARAIELDVEVLKAARSERKLKARTTLLGEFITERRLKMNLTQGEVAYLADVSACVIGHLELGRGSYGCKESVLAKIAKALECEIPSELIPKEKKKGRKSLDDRGCDNKMLKEISISLSGEIVEDLAEVRKKLGIKTNTDAVRRSIRLAKLFLEKKEFWPQK